MVKAALGDIEIRAARGDEAGSIQGGAPLGGVEDDADGNHSMVEGDRHRLPAGARHQGRRKHEAPDEHESVQMREVLRCHGRDVEKSGSERRGFGGGEKITVLPKRSAANVWIRGGGGMQVRAREHERMQKSLRELQISSQFEGVAGRNSKPKYPFSRYVRSTVA